MPEEHQQGPSEPPQPSFENDPYPRMIIVLIVITVVLFALVMGLVVFDLAQRAQEPTPETPVELEAPPAPGAPAPTSAPLPAEPAD